MRVLMSSLPSMGHVNPLLGVARVLRDAGHEVRLATAPGMAPHVRAAGITHVTMGFDVLRPADQLTARLEERLRRWLTDSFGFWVDDLYEQAKAWPPDVLMHDWSEVAGMVVARRLGIPSAVLGVALRPPVEYVAESVCWLGVDPDDLGGAARVFGDLLLNLYPPSFAPPGEPVLAHEHFFRPTFYDGGAGQEPPSWLSEFDEAPLIYASMGTFYGRIPGVFERIIEAAAGVEAQFLMTVGHDRDPNEFQPLPSNVRIEQHVPQTLVLPQCTAVVSQGAFNVILAALRCGLPVGCIPVVWTPTGFSDAQRCEQLGAALVYPVDDEETRGLAALGELDPERLRTMMVALLEDSTYRRAAQRIRAEIESMPDMHQAVKLIEAIAA